MTERTRVLKVGGGLLILLIAGLIVGFLTLGGEGTRPSSLPSPNVSPRTSPPGDSTTSRDRRLQIEQDYLRAWDVWAGALLRLDASNLPDVLTGSALKLITAQVNEQRSKNEPVRIRVEHNYRIVLIDKRTASVDDRYINHNVRLDPETLKPIEDDPNARAHTSFTLKLEDGTWKIAEIIQYE